jgi:hypothetical protein
MEVQIKNKKFQFPQKLMIETRLKNGQEQRTLEAKK